MSYRFQPVDESTARAILAWQYEPPYDFYNPDPSAGRHGIELLLDPANGYHAIVDETGGLVAYCCFGPDARVTGAPEDGDAVDVGAGLRPDLTGRGSGRQLLSAIVEFAGRRFGRRALRATIAAFNQRAVWACVREGFAPVATFTRPSDGQSFVVLRREVASNGNGARQEWQFPSR
jgi:RimJ/RimL family protein N-acetyltransferase